MPIPAEFQGKIIEFERVGNDKEGRAFFEMRDRDRIHVYIPAGKHLQTPHFSPRIGAGDRLYVREAWRTTYGLDWTDEQLGRPLKPREFNPKTTAIEYLADGDRELAGKDRRAMHMPRWASRITLIVEAVKIERLQDISEADAIAEGIEWKTRTSSGDFFRNFQNPSCPLMAYGAYRSLWDDINGDGAWDANPWVVAYSFAVHLAHIDEVSA